MEQIRKRWHLCQAQKGMALSKHIFTSENTEYKGADRVPQKSRDSDLIFAIFFNLVL